MVRRHTLVSPEGRLIELLLEPRRRCTVVSCEAVADLFLTLGLWREPRPLPTGAFVQGVLVPGRGAFFEVRDAFGQVLEAPPLDEVLARTLLALG